MVDVKKNLVLPTNVSSMCLRKLGLFCSRNMADDLYYLNQVKDQLVSEYGRESLRKDYPDFDKLEKRFDRLTDRLIEIKVWYDAIEDKRFDKKDAEVSIKKLWLQKASKVGLMQRELYDLFTFLNRATNLHKLAIPSEAFKILEHKDKKPLQLQKGEVSIN